MIFDQHHKKRFKLTSAESSGGENEFKAINSYMYLKGKGKLYEN